MINCQSLRGKSAAFAAVVDYVKPDVIIGTESWLDSSIHNSEVFPPNLIVHRKDRNLNGGGVFVAVNNNYNTSSVAEGDSNSEVMWAKVELEDSQNMTIGAFYRPPNTDLNYLRELENSFSSLPASCKQKPLVLAGDFNLPDINWKDNSTKSKATNSALCNQLLLNTENENLTQIQEEPTRNENILDLYFTNRPGLVKNNQTIPGISDHNIIIIDSDIKAKLNKAPPRKIFKYHKADWDKIRSEATLMNQELLSNPITDVNSAWNSFKTNTLKIIDKHVPSKLSSSRNNLPWFNHTLKKMSKKKQKLFNQAKKSSQQEDWETFRKHKKETLSSIKKAHKDYLSDILNKSLKEKNPKPFWKFIKHQRKDNVGVAPLKDNGHIASDSQTKAKILNAQFQSVFTREDYDGELHFDGDPSPIIADLSVKTEGLATLLKKLKPNKASGPDAIPNIFLKETAAQIAPFLTHLFNLSLTTGQLPDDWVNANITPVFKKGNRHDPANYRPVSLTSVCCKLMEHIICRHILGHLDKHNILTPYQHGFRAGHSCESQLLITMQDINASFDNKKQIDIAILDFSKAFDTVPHQRLLAKLRHYGISGQIENWIHNFLTTRQQSVIVDGAKSPPVKVDSGVPQGTVLGPLLFLCHINDLPNRVKSKVRLFADDCLLYREIDSELDHIALQDDLTSLQKWADMWGMQFNPTKCYVMKVGRRRSLSSWIYTLCDHPLEQVAKNPYLGLLLSEDLKWAPHINKITKKANSILGFLRRNLYTCPKTLKETAYFSLVRSNLEYSSPVWDPFLKGDIAKVERVQRRAARFVLNDYQRDSSVTAMLKSLGWQDLSSRRREARLVLLYKIINNLVTISQNDYLERNHSKTRSGNSHCLKVYSPNTEIYRNSFFPKTIIDWNKLPDNIILCSDLDAFKLVLGQQYD